MRDTETLFEALVAIATIVDDDNPAEVRLEGIRGVLATIGMRRAKAPSADSPPAPGVPDDENPEWTAEDFAAAKPFAAVFPDLVGPAGTTATSPAEERLKGILRAHEHVARIAPTVPPSLPRPRAKPFQLPVRRPKQTPTERPKQTPSSERPKALVDDPERQERIRRELAGKRPENTGPKKKGGV